MNTNVYGNIQNQYDPIHKIIVIGDSNTGKTSLIQTFSRQKAPLVPKPTIGVEYTSQIVLVNEDKKVKVQIWDTAGQQKYKAVTLNHYRNAVGAMIVFDITNRESYTNVIQWLAAVRQRADPHVQIALIGNKCDLDRKRSVTKQEALLFAENQLMIYCQTSVNKIFTVKEAFIKLVTKVYETKRSDWSGVRLKLQEKEREKRNEECFC